MRDEAWQRQCYGVLEAQLRTEVESSLAVKMGMGGHLMVAMSMLSDAQELLERNQNERARQMINCAKWVMHTYWKEPHGQDEAQQRG